MRNLKSGIEVFISYMPVEKDLAFLRELHTHLTPLQTQLIIDIWHDQDILAGMDLEYEINLHLENAAIFLLLISPDFMASKYYEGVEVKQALARHRKGEASVIPILLRPTALLTDLSRLKPLPENARPISSWSDHDEAFVDVVTGIKRRVEKLMLHLQSRRIALFGYEVHNLELYHNLQDFSLDKSYKVSYQDEEIFYQTWLQGKRFFTESDVLNKTWIKIGDNGYSRIIDFKGQEALVERPLLDESTTWQGKWKILDSGILRVNIGEYESDIYANQQGPTHSGIEFRGNQLQPHAYFVLLPLQEAEKSQYLALSLLAFEQLLRINPICVEAHKAKGDTLRKLQRYDEALPSYQKTVELDPKHKWAWYDMGDALRKLGRLEEAIEAYKQSIRVNSGFMWSWYDMGEVLCMLERYGEALEAFEQAQHLEPDRPKIFVSKGDVLYTFQLYKEALDAYKEALRLGHDLSTSWRYTIVIGLSNLGLIDLTPLEHGDTSVGNGHYWHYPDKSVHWSSETGIHATEGEIRSKWANQKWERGPLGYPTSEQARTEDTPGWYQHFQNGSIFVSPDGGVYAVDGDICKKWADLKWERGLLGYPVTDADDLPLRNGRHCHFQRGCIYWSPGTRAHEVHTEDILEKWKHLRWEQGFLGFPVHDEKASPDGVGRISNFQNGSIYWHPKIGAYAVRKEIYKKWRGRGWEEGDLGYPIADDQDLPDSAGRLSTFQHGFIYCHPEKGIYILRGEIGERWRQLRHKPDILKYPTSDQKDFEDGKGCYQHFQRGIICWSKETGAWEVYGSIKYRWEKLKQAGVVLGYPTTGEMGTPDGKGRYNHFQYGSIYWHPDIDENSAYEVYGAIYEKCMSMGWEQSPLGYPVTGECDAPGGRISYFERGAIYWSTAEGAVVIRGSGKALQKRFEDQQVFQQSLEQARTQKVVELCMVVYHIDHPGEKNAGYYRIGRNIDANGVAANGWSEHRSVPFLKAEEHQGASLALAHLDESGSPALFIFRIDHDTDKNRGYYRVGKNICEKVSWMNSVRVPGSLGKQNAGAGLAVADLSKSGRPDVVVFSVRPSGKTQEGFYIIGWNLNEDGQPTDGWGEPIAMPGDFGDRQNCIGMALADLDGNGQLDMLVFSMKSQEDGNYGYYRVGKHLNNQGVVTGGWGDPCQIPVLLGKQTQAASMAVVDLSKNGHMDIVVLYIDHDGTLTTHQNSGYYRVGRNLDTRGHATGGWSETLDVPGWFGSWNQGAGIALATLYAKSG